MSHQRGSVSRAPRILIVEDDPDVRSVLREILNPSCTISEAGDGEAALAILETDPPAVVLLDLNLGRGVEDGLRVLERARVLDPRLPIIVLSAYQDTDTVVRAMRAGASHFIGKTPRYDELLERVRLSLAERDRAVRNELHRRLGPEELVGTSRQIREVRRLAQLAVGCELPVLILGETGTGKGLLARCVHRLSSRASGPYRDVNVAGLPASVLDSELFGHERGAFTGADRRHHGLFELAAGGTILLDEIGDLPRDCQVKLLKVVEEGRFRRVGGESDCRSDARILAATHADVEGLVTTGAFRADLYHRLAGLVVRLPALRERLDDIPALARHFLGSDWQITESALASLAQHTWPGNVRELEHTLRRATLFATGRTIEVSHLSFGSRAGASAEQARTNDELLRLRYAEALGEATKRFRHRYLERLLERCRGNISQAARESGLSRGHLHELIADLGLEPRRARFADAPRQGSASRSNINAHEA